MWDGERLRLYLEVPPARVRIRCMARYTFNLPERWAVFSTHGTRQGTKCWLCDEPVNFRDMEVDHILPESLFDAPAALQTALEAFGLSPKFELNSFENWLPSHPRCNR